MIAAYCRQPRATDPLSALIVGDQPEPAPAAGWTLVRMRTMSLNMRDIGILRGAGVAPGRYPMILGSDGCGVLPDGTEVVIHSSVVSESWTGPEHLDPNRTILSEYHQGTYAETALVPLRNAVARPHTLSAIEAACLPTAWLTAYRMLFVTAGVMASDTIVVRGRDRLGTIAAAAISLAAAAGVTVWVDGREEDRELALRLGAESHFPDLDRLPRPVDAVLDAGISGTNWMRAVGHVRPGGQIVCAGYRGARGETAAETNTAFEQLIFREVRLLGSGMGTAVDLADLMYFLGRTGLRPSIAEVMDFGRVGDGMRAMLSGRVIGKIVFQLGS